MQKIYFDNVSATQVLPEVINTMMPYFIENFGNPSSLHSWGDAARDALDKARTQVANLIGAKSDEIIFTSSGSESNNLAVKGLALAQRQKGKHIIISSIEHFSVMNSAKTLEKSGFEITYIPVDKYGVIDPDDVKKAIRKDTVLISIMHANNEIGSLQPIKEVSKIAKENNVIFHSDGVATAGIIDTNVEELGVDSFSFSSHQFYGPKGVGALFLKEGTRIIPLIDGGIQEFGRRAGTENIPGIVGMGKAAEIAKNELKSRMEYLKSIRDKLLIELPNKIKNVIITGHPSSRLPNNASFCIEFIEGEAMLMLLDAKGIAVTSGSACTSRALKASHVLLATGIKHEIAQGSILFSIGIFNKLEDVDYTLEVMPSIVEKLRQMSPLYAKYIKSQ